MYCRKTTGITAGGAECTTACLHGVAPLIQVHVIVNSDMISHHHLIRHSPSIHRTGIHTRPIYLSFSSSPPPALLHTHIHTCWSKPIKCRACFVRSNELASSMFPATWHTCVRACGRAVERLRVSVYTARMIVCRSLCIQIHIHIHTYIYTHTHTHRLQGL